MSGASFVFVSDPGHGWLLVKRDHFNETSLTAAYVSSCSFISMGDTIALEEDVDAPFFLGVWERLFGTPEIIETDVAAPGPRAWPIFGQRTEAGPPQDHLAGLALRIAAISLERSEHEVIQVMGQSAWGSIEGMIAREFGRPCKGYFPSCGMQDAQEAVIAECFDAAAVLMRDPRRANRHVVA